MSKRVVISQRVDVIESYNERRDALDQQWTDFFDECGFTVFPIPSKSKDVEMFVNIVQPELIVLSGGNSPVSYHGNAVERDEIDKCLIDMAIKKSIPLLGVCRGMQSIVLYFGGSLRTVQHHIATEHKITCSNGDNMVVNSYHALAIDRLPPCFDVRAVAADGVIESIMHKEYPMQAIMYHPERYTTYRQFDKNLVKDIIARRK